MTRPVAPPVDLPDDGSLVVALSGGPDSCALLSLVAHRPLVRAVHVNHHLRPTAHLDEAVARSWCARFGVPLHVVHLDGARLAADPRGVSAAARVARYDALAEAAGPDGAFVLTAHTADDRLETLWIRLATGCGVTALDGPRRRTRIADVDVIRPLLRWWRSDIEARVEAIGLPVARDPSNHDRRRLRATIRHDVLPPLVTHIGSVAPLARSLSTLATDARVHRSLLDRLASQIVIDGGTSSRTLARERLARLDDDVAAALVHHVLKGLDVRADRQFVHRIIDRRHGPDTSHLDGPGASVDFDEGAVRIVRTRVRRPPAVSPAPDRCHIPLRPGPSGAETAVRVPGGIVTIMTSTQPAAADGHSTAAAEAAGSGHPIDATRPTNSDRIEWFDADRLSEHLVVTRAAPDTEFTPFGRSNPQTISAVLRADGVPATQRTAPLVVKAGRDLLVVLGHRRADIAPITTTTRRRIGIAWTPDASLPPDATSLGW